MKRNLFIWLVLLLGSSIFSSCIKDSLQELKESTEKVLPTPSKYLALGDSYTLGEGVKPAESWPMQLSVLLDKAQLPIGEPLVLAQAGWTTGDLLKYLRSVNMPNDYGFVSLMIGVNNHLKGGSLKEFKTEFHFLLGLCTQLAQKNPQHVLVFTIPNWGVTPFAVGKNSALITDQISQFNQVIQDEAKAANIAVVDVNDLSLLVLKTPSMLAPDKLHYSGAMYAQWAQRALPIASSLLVK